MEGSYSSKTHIKMRKVLLILAILFIAVLTVGFIHLFTHVPKLSEQHGVLDAELFLSEGELQPLVVAFGGGGGGNDWSRNYLKGKRDSLNQLGYSVLAIGYFKSNDAPKELDRISLNAIRDTIFSVAENPQIDASKIILMGGSKGGELVLNLASRYEEINGVIALSTSNVSFPALTLYSNTSSWSYQNEEVPYVPAPLKIIGPALKGDLYTAHSMMLEDAEAVKKAEIPVENINGPILILSGKNDEQWPAPEMSDEIVKRLEENNFPHYYSHVKIDGGHIAPLNNFNLVYDFLEQNFSE